MIALGLFIFIQVISIIVGLTILYWIAKPNSRLDKDSDLNMRF